MISSPEDFKNEANTGPGFNFYQFYHKVKSLQDDINLLESWAKFVWERSDKYRYASRPIEIPVYDIRDAEMDNRESSRLLNLIEKLRNA